MNDEFKPMAELPIKPETPEFNLWQPAQIQKKEAPVEKVEMISADELAAIKKQAYDEAYQQAILQAEHDITAQTQQLVELYHLLVQPMQLIDDVVQNQVISMVGWLAKAVLKKEIELDESLLLKIIDEIREMITEVGMIESLSVNPEDFQYLSQALQTSDNEHLLAKMKADERLSRGEFKLDTHDALLDGSIASRLEELTINQYCASESNE